MKISTLLVQLSISSSVLLAGFARAATDCPDDLPLDRLLPGTQIEFKGSIKPGNPKSDFSFLEYSGNKEPNQEKNLNEFSEVPLGHRAIKIQIQNPVSKTSDTIGPFICALKSTTSVKDIPTLKGAVNFHFKDNPPCPISAFTARRALLDWREAPMTLGSLKYNLGPDFHVAALCSSSNSYSGAAPVNNNSEKNNTPQYLPPHDEKKTSEVIDWLSYELPDFWQRSLFLLGNSFPFQIPKILRKCARTSL